MAELDRDVAAFWHAVLRFGPSIKERVLAFDPTRDAVRAVADHQPRDVVEHGFRTLVLNRTRRGGILAPGASLTRSGENGRGISFKMVSGDHRQAHRRDRQTCEANRILRN